MSIKMELKNEYSSMTRWFDLFLSKPIQPLA
jgi:hypothetical protein